MNDLKKEFSEYTSEYLLELRARGESLGDTTHQVIEEIFAERGERLPEKPEKPIISSRKKAVKESKSTTMFQIIGLVFTLFISAVITEITKTERLLQLIALAIVIGWVIFKIQKNESIFSFQDNSDKLTPLMLCAIKGKIKETQELIAFGDDVNELSSKGNTALIYAAINNQLDIVEYLIKSGANTSIKSSTNMTALDIAEKYKHGNVAEFLKSHINKS